MCVHVHVSYVCSCRWLAYTLVCVDVALAVRAGVCHILEVVDQAGNQTAAEVAPDEEAEEAEQRVHESHVVRDAGDDGLLTVWTHSLHRRGLEHLPLQHRHGGGAAWGQDGRRVASHVDEGPRPGTHMSGRRMREVARWMNVGATWWRLRHGHGHRHGAFSRDVWGKEARLRGLVGWRAVVWRQRLPLNGGSGHRLSILLLNEGGAGTSRVRRRGVTGHTGRTAAQGIWLDVKLPSQLLKGKSGVVGICSLSAV